MVTSEQKAEIAGLISDLNMGREEGLALYAEATGREVPTTNLLTSAEAEKVLDALVARSQASEEVADAEVVDEDAATFDEYVGGAA